MNLISNQIFSQRNTTTNHVSTTTLSHTRTQQKSRVLNDTSQNLLPFSMRRGCRRTTCLCEPSLGPSGPKRQRQAADHKFSPRSFHVTLVRPSDVPAYRPTCPSHTQIDPLTTPHPRLPSFLSRCYGDDYYTSRQSNRCMRKFHVYLAPKYCNF